MKLYCLLLCSCLLLFSNTDSALSQTESPATVEALKTWLAKPLDERGEFAEQPFRNNGLTKDEAKEVQALLWEDYVARNKKSRQQEWKDKVIKLGDRSMKFEFKVFGDKPKDGRSLFISMHGGGGAPARVNEQQWKNQIRLYEPEEGVYLAPRAPTNTWNLWHEAHIDKFFQRIIQDAVLFEDVNPNRVYLMGYSAGGDGVYQLAPRMADSLAAAAMMAGHPNDASPLGLRNIGFTLHMGGKDKAYNRNKIAAQWKTKLAKLKKQDPDGYQHEVVIHEECGHWMNKKDAVAVPWMSKFTRNPRPSKIVWFQSGVTHDSFYWMAQRPKHVKAATEITASIEDQTIKVESFKGLEQVTFQLNDQILDLDDPVIVDFGNDNRFTLKVGRRLSHIYDSIEANGDPELIYSAKFTAPFPKAVLEKQSKPDTPKNSPASDSEKSK